LFLANGDFDPSSHIFAVVWVMWQYLYFYR